LGETVKQLSHITAFFTFFIYLFFMPLGLEVIKLDIFMSIHNVEHTGRLLTLAVLYVYVLFCYG